MSRHSRDDDSDTDWDSIYDEAPAEDEPEQARIVEESPSAKAREADRERGEGSTPQETSSQAQRPTHPSSSWANEETPLLDAGPPPPAYSDVAASPYRSTNREPQSMDDRTDMEAGNTERADTDDPVKKRGRYRHLRRPRMLLKLAILAMGIVLTTTLVGTTWHDSTHEDKDHSGHTGGNETYQPVVPPGAGWWHSPRLENCHFEYYSLNHYYEFSSPQSFSFIELMEDSHLLVREVDGNVKITAPAGKQDAAIVVGISLATTGHHEITQFNVKQTDDSLSLKAPSLKATGSGSGNPCMVVAVTISIRPDINLSDLEVALQHLNLQVDASLFQDDAALRIQNSTEFTTIRGDIAVASWSSRETIIEVISGSVRGSYDLRDLLSIKTQSGSIAVEVKPQPVDKLAPAPAEFLATTTSGSIKAKFPTYGSDKDIPEREYRSRVETYSASISGSYILGHSSTFKTTSGSISADVLPYAADMFASSLRSETYSGHTTINMLSPFLKRGQPITRFQSLHKTVSSGITLAYPQEWEGVIAGNIMSGSLKVKGKDVEVIDLRKGPVGSKIFARKGDGHSKLDFSTVSGSVDVTVGDLY